jgi:small subunit ribosomal protein S11
MEEDTKNTTTTQAPDTSEKAPTSAPKKKKGKRVVANGQVHVQASFNNTIITVTDSRGATLSTASAGGCGFRGSKKGTAYAAQVAAEKAINTAKQTYSLTKADVFIKGIGLGRESGVRAMIAAGVTVDSIKDVTGVPHGGVRPKKARRV